MQHLMRKKYRCISSSYVTVTNDEEIHQLNLEHRNVDSPTDVLSFPMQELSPGSFEPQDIDLDSGRVPLGDIVISVERARAQAEEYGHSEAREIGYLCVHSLLHLLGYDHMEEEDKRLMRSREEAVMAQLDLKRDEE